MNPIRSALFWAAAILLLALANWFGLIADKNATTMFAILPAVWIAVARPRCRRNAAA
jgi:hypothetical protein